MEPKVTNMELQGAKREPKGDQSASKSRLGRQGRFWEPKRVTAQDILGAILVLFLIIFFFINAKFDHPKTLNLISKGSQIRVQIDAKSNQKSMPKLVMKKRSGKSSKSMFL